MRLDYSEGLKDVDYRWNDAELGWLANKICRCSIENRRYDLNARPLPVCRNCGKIPRWKIFQCANKDCEKIYAEDFYHPLNCTAYMLCWNCVKDLTEHACSCTDITRHYSRPHIAPEYGTIVPPQFTPPPIEFDFEKDETEGFEL